MGLNLDEILASLEEEKTAEDKLADSLSEQTTEEVEKEAEAIDSQGRTLARSFVDELQKIAVGTGPYTGNSADATKNINQLVTGDVPEAGKVDAIVEKLKQLTAATEASVPAFEVNGESTPAPAKAPDETAGSIAADATLAISHQAALPNNQEEVVEEEKKASAAIVDSLYNMYFEDTTEDE
jgi:hypothetical protein